MEYQLKHEEFQSSIHDMEIVVMTDNLQRPSNYGMLIRVCESLGIKEVIFITKEYSELTTKMKRSSRSAEQNLKIRFETCADEVFKEFKDLGYCILGLEYTSASKNIAKFTIKSNNVLLLLGNEAIGLSQEWIEQSDQCVHIPMYGKNSSMNVVMATGIALWSLIQK